MVCDLLQANPVVTQHGVRRTQCEIYLESKLERLACQEGKDEFEREELKWECNKLLRVVLEKRFSGTQWPGQAFANTNTSGNFLLASRDSMCST